MELTLQELNIFQKYCDNRMNYDEFVKGMLLDYDDKDYYISKQWEKFRDNPVRFITSRSEAGLFDRIISSINKSNYKG